MRGLTWLHISDWHQKGKEFDRKVVRDALIKDIKKRTEISANLSEINFIVFSGDLAHSGRKEEYEASNKEFFGPLLAATGVSPDRLFVVPGNHDLDRTKLELLPASLLEPIELESQVQKWLFDQEKKALVLQQFQAFTNFIRDLTKLENPDYASVRSWEICGKKVALLGINSCWMCGRNKNKNGEVDDRGFVLVGEPQILDSLESISDAEIKIAVMHHPFNWLAEFDSDRVENRLMKECDFILHGHLHKPKVDMIQSIDGNCAVIPAGACYDRRVPSNRYANAYNYVHLDFDNGQVIVFLRCWSDKQNGWRDDVDSCPNGKFVFRLPKLAIPHQISSSA